MTRDTFRILSPTAILGYGFPEASLRRALTEPIDLIAVDAGSVDAGPYYLAMGKAYVGKAALRRDLRLLLAASREAGCPLIVGSAGFSGEGSQLEVVAGLVRGLISEQWAGSCRMAVIPSDIDPAWVLAHRADLEPLGRMESPVDEAVRGSRIVAQIGIDPFITALDNGADVILAGRAYDPAVFAAAPIRQGFDPGICYHAAKILECGAIACDPGSGSDCLVAELTRDGEARISSPNPRRRVTVRSIAAHTLYEKSHPSSFALPGGRLDIAETEFFTIDEQRAGFRGSRFHAGKRSLKIEGAAPKGHRVVSVLALSGTPEECPVGVFVYGFNGVETHRPGNGENEWGLVVTTLADDAQEAADALAFVRSTLLHFGYTGRLSTAGNLAFPFSPSDLRFHDESGAHGGLFVAGTRDPVFQGAWDEIEEGVRSALSEQHPTLAERVEVRFMRATADTPWAIAEAIGVDREDAVARARQQQATLKPWQDDSRPSFSEIDAGPACAWTLHHLVPAETGIDGLVAITMHRLEGSQWSGSERIAVAARSVGDESVPAPSVEGDPHALRDWARPVSGAGTRPLVDHARVIRSKNAGVTEITFDVIFEDREGFAAACRSAAFSPEAVRTLLGVDESEVIGCYAFPPALAIKVTLHRRLPAGNPGDRDVFGAQQHARLLGLRF